MVELVEVTKRFGNFTAVAGVTLKVASGEFLTLLGPSGCGKTTLLRMISGFEQPTTGAVLLDGRDVTALPPYRRDVNQVFQSYALFPHLSVQENIAFGLRIRKLPAAQTGARVADALKLVGLEGLAGRKPAQLSGGQRQRVALARALVCEPRVLLLDEPLAALDAKLRRAMQVELKRLQKQVGITFVFVTHDQDEAMVMSDRIAVVNQGKIEQIGPVQEIYQRPATRFVADFLGQTNLLEAVIEREEKHCMVTLGGEFRLEIAASAWPGGAWRALASVRPEKVGISATASATLVAGTIEELLFRGSATQVVLRTAGGTPLLATLNDGAAGVRKAVGSRVYLSIGGEDIVFLPDELGSS